MPARTRLSLAIAGFVVLSAAILFTLQGFNSDDTQTYDLSNQVVLSNNEIATNTNNTGKALAQVDLKSVNGATVATQTFVGRPTIINIWYSTCEPCRRELPVLALGAEAYSDKVRFIGINIKDSAKVATEFALEYGVKFEIFLDTNGSFISSSGITTAPVTLAINAQGLVIRQFAGELSTDKLNSLVAELLK